MSYYSLIYSIFLKDIQWEVEHGLDLTIAYHSLSLFRNIGSSSVVENQVSDAIFQSDLNYLTNLIKDKTK